MFALMYVHYLKIAWEYISGTVNTLK